MDILKKVYLDPSICQVTPSSTIVQGKEINDTQKVTFSLLSSKIYTLRSILFFILHREEALKDYIPLCKANNVSPISYVDKATILKELEQYEPLTVKGFFDFPKYTSEKQYEIANTQERNIIVIPQFFNSKINIENIEDLLLKGIYTQVPFNPLVKNNKTFTINGISFEATNDLCSISNFNKVKAIFVENSESNEIQDFIRKCPKDVILFTLKNEKFNSFKIELSGTAVKNYNDIVNILVKN